MKPVALLGFLCAIGASACGAGPTTPSGSTFTLSGRVTESAPTEANIVSGARVEVLSGPRRGLVTTADAAGRFVIPDVSGAFDLGIRAAGYEDARIRVEASAAEVTRSFPMRPTLAIITETIGSLSGPRRAATSFFRDVHHDGMIEIRQLYFYYSRDPANPLTRTVEIWNGQQLVGAASINKQQWHGIDLLLAVTGGARYEIRITGGDWSIVTIASPN